MTDIPNETDTTNEPPAKAAEPASPYPTVQILQAAMQHRESIRRSFESQRATLAEAIAAQREAVTQAVANTRQSTDTLDTFLQTVKEAIPVAIPEPGVTSKPADPVTQADAAVVASTPTEKLVAALSMLTASGSTAVKTAAAQHAVATQQFLDAIKDMITEEVSRRLDQKTAAPGADEISDTGSATSANADPTEGQ
ncbi:MAG: hypothetical protein M0R41_09435 [Methylobacter tundripaludum]|nr:hypothetical protein [Methylobacter tundripaludum]